MRATRPKNSRDYRVSITVRVTDPNVLRNAAAEMGVKDDPGERYTLGQLCQAVIDNFPDSEERLGFTVLESEVEPTTAGALP